MVSLRRHARDWRLYTAAGVAWASVALAAIDPKVPKASPAHQAQATQFNEESGKAARPSNAGDVDSDRQNQADKKHNTSAKQTGKQPDPEPVRWTDWFMAASAVVSAIFAGVVGVYTAKLFKVGQDQHKAAVDALALAKTSADAATAQGQAAIASERAWLLLEGSVSPVNEFIPTQQTRNYAFRFCFRNFGKTLAIVTDISAQLVYRREADSWPNHALKFKRLGVETIIDPKGIVESQAVGRLSPSEVTAAQAGNGDVLILGAVRYQTVFGNECETAFCVRWEPIMGSQRTEGGADLNYRK